MAQLTIYNEQVLSNKPLLFTNSELFKLFIPLTIEQLLIFMVGLTDSIMVASVGEAAVSGVSLCDFIMAFLLSIFAALATGGAVISGQYLGKQDFHKARDATNQLMRFTGFVALLIMVMLYAAKSFILSELFGQISPEVHQHADTYLSIVAISIPFMGLYSVGAAMFRSMGNTKLPMLISLVMGICNIFGNAIALYVFDFGTAGIAVSTVIVRIAGTIFILYIAINPQCTLHIYPRLLYPLNWIMLRRIMQIGIPYGLENGLFYFGRVLVLGIVATFGTAAIAANAVGGTIALFQVLPGMAIGLGLTTIISRCVGAGDFGQAILFNKKVMGIVYLTHIIMNILVLAALPFIMDIYALSARATELTLEIVYWHGAMSILIWPLAYTLPVTFRSAGDAAFPMFVGTISMFLCRVALAYVLGVWLNMGLLGTWLAMFVDWIFKAIIFIWRYFSRKWMSFRLV